MKSPVLFSSALLAILLGGLLGTTGCSDEEVVPNWGGYVEIRTMVLDEITGQPVAGVKVLVMDPRSNLPVAGPVVSDEHGQGYFGVLPEGPWQLLAFGGVHHLIFILPETLDFTKAGKSGFPLVGLADKTATAPIPSLGLPIRVITVPPDSLPRIAGKIFDTDTGFPLDQAFVSLSPDLTGYEKQTGPSDDVTLADGEFSVSQIPFSVNPISGNIFQVNPLRITRAGYRPLIWSHDPPNGSFELDFQGMLIGLEPLRDTDTGSVRGRLLRDGEPVAGVAVGIGVVDLPGSAKAAVGMPGWTGLTDNDGFYEIGNLPAGTYFLQPGFLVGDGSYFPNQPGNVLAEVGQGQAVEVADLVVLHELAPLSPAHGAVVSSPPDSLHWTPVPGADSYEVTFDRGVLGRTSNPSFPLTPEMVTGTHSWAVNAYTMSDELIGTMQILIIFTYAP